MRTVSNIFGIFTIFFLTFLGSNSVYGQNVEVNGNLKVSLMDTVTLGQNYIVRNSDGILAEKDFNNSIIKYLSSLPEGIQWLIDMGESPLNIFKAGVPAKDIYGKYYAGGIIFLLDTNDIYRFDGLVCTEMDLSYGEGTKPFDIRWSDSGCTPDMPWVEDFPPSGPSAEIGDGYQNTLDIVEKYPECIELGDAAKLCYDLSLNGFANWYLPSILELEAMSENLIPDGNDLYGIFCNSGKCDYWSSSQVNSERAWSSKPGIQIEGTFKYQTLSVKAIREF